MVLIEYLWDLQNKRLQFLEKSFARAHSGCLFPSFLGDNFQYNSLSWPELEILMREPISAPECLMKYIAFTYFSP